MFRSPDLSAPSPSSTNVQSPVEACDYELILEEDRLLNKWFNTGDVRKADGNQEAKSQADIWKLSSPEERGQTVEAT